MKEFAKPREEENCKFKVLHLAARNLSVSLFFLSFSFISKTDSVVVYAQHEIKVPEISGYSQELCLIQYLVAKCAYQAI